MTITTPAATPAPAPTAAVAYREARQRHWGEFVRRYDDYRGWGGYYHRRLAEVYSFLIPPGRRVLEIGCGTGNLLAALKPAQGVGIDFSTEMIGRAQQRHPELQFIHADAHDFAVESGGEGAFDAIILSDLVNDLWDVQQVFERLRPLVHPRTRIVLNTYSRLWEWPLSLAEKMGVAHPTLYQNWLTVPDISNLLYLAGFETMRSWREVLWPVRTPGIDALCNRFLVKMWPFKHGALTNFVLARPLPQPPAAEERPPKVSVIVAARNEEGNVENIFDRVPQMGGGTELIFVEGHSKDDTYGAIERGIVARPSYDAKLFRQPGKGKGDAVRKGFAEATGDILMILDADLTVPPEDLPRFYDALVSGKGEFVNGVRLVYPMEKRAMRLLNLAGNKFFSLAFSWLLDQSIKDTLCGTKVLRKDDYDMIVANRAYFGDFDPFGDFDLIFGAAKLNLKIVDLPIRYRERVYGDTNIQRWSHGWLLLRMVAFAARRIKFV
jgi:SAM-dependent methyltransferase